MIKHLKIYDAITCQENSTIVDVAKIFKKTQAKHIYVIDANKKPAGIISTVDIVNRIVADAKDASKVMAKEIMSSPVDSVNIGQEAEFAMKIMMQRKTYSCLVTENGRIKGVVDYKSVMEEIIKRLKEE